MRLRYRCRDCDHNCTLAVMYEVTEVSANTLMREFQEAMCKIFGRG